jgi:hypothetical protein
MCALYGGARDISLFRTISREVVNDIIEQEIGYYKIFTNGTESNLYGESSEKTYVGPVLLKCLINRENQSTTSGDPGVDRFRSLQIAFLRDDLIPYNLVPEVGDALVWNNDYYEVNNIIENQLILGKDPNYAISNYLGNENTGFGSSFSIIIDVHYTRPENLNIQRVR